MDKALMQRDDLGKFALKNGEHRSVRSLRLTDTTWWRIGAAAESLSVTRADLLEQMFRNNDHPLPSNTRWEKEIAPSNTPRGAGEYPSNTREDIERLKLEVTHFREENAKLLEQVRELSQGKDLEVIRERVLSSLKLGKQAPGYKTALSALKQFIKLLRDPV